MTREMELSDQAPHCELFGLRQQPNVQNEKSSLHSAIPTHRGPEELWHLPWRWHVQWKWRFPKSGTDNPTNVDREWWQLQGDFWTSDLEMIFGTCRSAMQQHHPGRLHIRQQWDHLQESLVFTGLLQMRSHKIRVAWSTQDTNALFVRGQPRTPPHASTKVDHFCCPLQWNVIHNSAFPGLHDSEIRSASHLQSHTSPAKSSTRSLEHNDVTFFEITLNVISPPSSLLHSVFSSTMLLPLVSLHSFLLLLLTAEFLSSFAAPYISSFCYCLPFLLCHCCPLPSFFDLNFGFLLCSLYNLGHHH